MRFVINGTQQSRYCLYKLSKHPKIYTTVLAHQKILLTEIFKVPFYLQASCTFSQKLTVLLAHYHPNSFKLAYFCPKLPKFPPKYIYKQENLYSLFPN